MSAVDPQYSISAQISDIPSSVSASTAKRSIPADCSLVNIVSQSSDQTSGGQILINLPNTPNTFIKNGSVYLRFKLSAKTTVLSNADQWIRSGSAIGNAELNAQASSGKNVGSWSSAIQRITISAGSQVLEQINNYNVFHEALLLHSGGGYSQYDMQLLEGGQFGASAYSADTWKVANAAAVGTTVGNVYVTIPLFCGLFNAQDGKDLPLGLMSGGLQVMVDLAPDNWTFAATNCSPTMIVSQASLSYEAVTVSSEYVNGLRADLAQQGQLFQMPFVSSLIMNVGSLATLDVTYGVGLNSLKAVLFTQKATPVITAYKYSIADAPTALRVYADGKLQNNFQMSDITTYYAELNRALGNLQSRTSTSGVADMLVHYHDQYFYSGLSFNKFNDGNLTFTGTKCQQLQFHLEKTGTAGSTFIMMFYDAILTVSPLSSECAVLR